MLKTKKVLIALFLAIVMVFSFAGCNKNMGTFYSLQEAYDNGLERKRIIFKCN